jgi:phosphoserine phosphatase
MPTTIILVRHGQTEWNRVERFRGQFDVPLNHNGLAQAFKTGQKIASKWKPAALYASPMGRAQDTARQIGQFCDLPVQSCQGLIDINYGAWQGLTPAEVSQTWPEMIKLWYETPDAALIPGGETLAQVRMRAMNALREICLLHPGSSLVLVSHTVINRLILLGILGLGNDHFWRIRQEPCAINVFEVEKDQFTLVSTNDTCHLDG